MNKPRGDRQGGHSAARGRAPRSIHACCHEDCPSHHRPSEDTYPLTGKGNWGLWLCKQCYERRLRREQWGEANRNRKELGDAP